MTPAARLQAAIELAGEIAEAARAGGAAADTLIARYFKLRRYAGSKDRRAVRDLVFAAIRRSGEPPVSGRAALLGLARETPELLPLFDGSPHGPAPLAEGEPEAARCIAPGWLLDRFDPALPSDELPALLGRAPLDVRSNRLKGTREAARALLPEARPTPLSPLGLRLPDGTRVEENDAWRTGLVEIQDEGSQLICLGCEAAPGSLVVDLCAGAGGKTLALAAEMGGEGRIVACDSDRARLSRMAPRLERAGVAMVEPVLLDPGREAAALAAFAGRADLVLVDAPCSGTGTWRRNPETRWRVTPERLAAGRPSGTPARSRCNLAAPRGSARLCGLLAAGRGGQGPGRGAGRPFIAGSGAVPHGGRARSGRRPPAQPGPGGHGRLFRRAVAKPVLNATAIWLWSISCV